MAEEASDAFAAWAGLALLIFVLFLVGLVTILMRQTADEREACERAGGVYVNTRSDDVCVAKESVIQP